MNTTTDLVDAKPVCQLTMPLPIASLHGLAEAVARRPELWTTMAHHSDSGRRPIRLGATAGYEIWIIGWLPGQGLELHDHGPSQGVLRVLDGTLLETVLTGRRLRPDLLPAGRCRPLAQGSIHSVRGWDRPAASVHVYSPPLTSMTHYSMTGERIGTERLTPVPAAIPAAALAQALHPVGGGS